MLTRWKWQYREDDLLSDLHEDTTKERARLRKENELLRQEREILKRTTGGKRAKLAFAGRIANGAPSRKGTRAGGGLVPLLDRLT